MAGPVRPAGAGSRSSDRPAPAARGVKGLFPRGARGGGAGPVRPGGPAPRIPAPPAPAAGGPATATGPLPARTFTNPLYAGADPWVVRHDGWYYLCQAGPGSR